MSEKICSFCNAPLPEGSLSDEHEASCRFSRLEVLSAAISDNIKYREKVSMNRRLQAELIVLFGDNEHQLRSFLREILNDYVMEDATVRAVNKLAAMDPSKKSPEDIAKDAALIAEVQALKIPVIQEDI
jgi:hypothetical protein